VKSLGDGRNFALAVGASSPFILGAITAAFPSKIALRTILEVKPRGGPRRWIHPRNEKLSVA